MARPGAALSGRRPLDSDGYARDDAGSVWPERTMERAKVDDGAEFELTGTISSQWYVGTGADPESLIPGEPFATGAVKEVLDGVRAGQDVGFDEILTLFRARGREVARSPRSPMNCARRSSGMSSPGSPTATSTTPMCARSSAALRLFEGPAVAQPPRHPLSARTRRHR